MIRQKFFFSIFFLVVLPVLGLGQGENNIWFFSDGSGVDFNGNNPVGLMNSGMNSRENTAVVCDSGGRLLFYSNGEKVWNRQGEIMTNGEDLKGHVSARQGLAFYAIGAMDRPARPGLPNQVCIPWK